MDRLALLRQMVEKNPADPFPRYGLAMELRSRGDRAEACEAFEHLVTQHPEYIPTYLMYGGVLVDMGAREQAAEVFDRGIAAARDAHDGHALSELEAARAELA